MATLPNLSSAVAVKSLKVPATVGVLCPVTAIVAATSGVTRMLLWVPTTRPVNTSRALTDWRPAVLRPTCWKTVVWPRLAAAKVTLRGRPLPGRTCASELEKDTSPTNPSAMLLKASRAVRVTSFRLPALVGLAMPNTSNVLAAPPLTTMLSVAEPS